MYIYREFFNKILDMKNDDKKDNKDKKDLDKIKNELENEFGMKMFHTEGDLPPELESMFLERVLAFEKQMSNSKKTTVYKIIGEPTFIEYKNIDDKDIDTEITRISKIMDDHNVHLDTFYSISNKELYRFITTELFYEEVDHLEIEGLVLHFNYEEFHPNHEYDIEERIHNLFNFIFDTKDESEWLYGPIDFTNFIDTKNNPVSEKRLKKIVKSFKDSFSSIEITNFEILDINFNLEEDTGESKFLLEYNATMSSTKEEIAFSGEGVLKLTYNGYWSIVSINIPGFKI